MSFGLWIAVLATLNFLLAALWFRIYDRRPLTESDHFCAAQDEALDRLSAQRLRDDREQLYAAMGAALDEERRAMEAAFDAAEQEYLEGEFVRAIEAWLESREMTS